MRRAASSTKCRRTIRRKSTSTRTFVALTSRSTSGNHCFGQSIEGRDSPIDGLIGAKCWRWSSVGRGLLGFPNQTDDAIAFTTADVHALELTQDLMELGILGPDSQAALVRTWGRSYARLAEWQTSLLADVAIEGADPGQKL